MKELKYVITDPIGIHARPAGILINKAKEFTSDIKIGTEDKMVDAKRILGVMGLGAKQGTEITITAEGEDEAAAIVALEELLKAQL